VFFLKFEEKIDQTKHILTQKDPTPVPGKRKKSKKSLTWFLDLLTRLVHAGSVGSQFFGGIVFSEVDLPGKRNKKKFEKKIFFN
jgi:hypothetical protein